MSAFYNIMLGYFFGFALGVGCALAVFYAIYSGGYRKAIEHSLLQQKPKRYLESYGCSGAPPGKGKGARTPSWRELTRRRRSPMNVRHGYD